MFSGGDRALTAGKHVLKIEIRPYLRTGNDVKTGELIATGGFADHRSRSRRRMKS
jgi:hypothetical protein